MCIGNTDGPRMLREARRADNQQDRVWKVWPWLLMRVALWPLPRPWHLDHQNELHPPPSLSEITIIAGGICASSRPGRWPEKPETRKGVRFLPRPATSWLHPALVSTTRTSLRRCSSDRVSGAKYPRRLYLTRLPPLLVVGQGTIDFSIWRPHFPSTPFSYPLTSNVPSPTAFLQTQ